MASEAHGRLHVHVRVGQSGVVRAPERVEVQRAELVRTRLNQTELPTLRVGGRLLEAGRGTNDASGPISCSSPRERARAERQTREDVRTLGARIAVAAAADPSRSSGLRLVARRRSAQRPPRRSRGRAASSFDSLPSLSSKRASLIRANDLLVSCRLAVFLLHPMSCRVGQGTFADGRRE